MMLSVKDEKTPINSSQNPFQFIFIYSFFFFRKEDEIRGMISLELSNELIHSVWRRANARNVSFLNLSRGNSTVTNSFDKTKFLFHSPTDAAPQFL